MPLLKGGTPVEGLLPQEFSDLEHFVDQWALATQGERESKRRSTTLEQRKEFYDAMTPRLETILTWLDRFPREEMPVDARRLLHLILSLAEIAPTVELYRGSATVPYSFEESRFIAVHRNRQH